MKVSVIIPTYNEEKVIKECLESLKNQSFRDMEVIVVDDGSMDTTLDILKTVSSSYFSFHLLQQKHKGPGEARNLGSKKARGDIFVFIDADMTFDKEFIRDLVGPIEEGKSKGTFSKEEYVLNYENIWARCWNLNKNIRSNRIHSKDYPDKQKVFRAILKSEFERVNGFESGGHYTDDWSLSEKLGYDATISGGKFYHKNSGSLMEVFYQAKWVAKRPYKLGLVGFLVALIRTSLPVSMIIGLFKSIIYLTPEFLVFKLTFDLGSFTGILEYLICGKGFK